MKPVLLIAYVLMLTGCSTVPSLTKLLEFSFLHDRRDSVSIKLDARIKERAMVALHAVKQIKDKSHFNIACYNGKVLVTGEAETEDVRDIIIANIRIILGVKLIHNAMTIGSIATLQSLNEDALLAIKVSDAVIIKDKFGFDTTHVKVVIANKVAYLMGLVQEEEALIATKAVQQVAGINKIITIFEYPLK